MEQTILRKRKNESIAFALKAAFTWADSPEDSDYWIKITDEYDKR